MRRDMGRWARFFVCAVGLLLVGGACSEIDVSERTTQRAVEVSEAGATLAHGGKWTNFGLTEVGCVDDVCSFDENAYVSTMEPKEELEILRLSTTSVYLQKSRAQDAGLQMQALLERLAEWKQPVVRLSIELQEVDFDFALLANTPSTEVRNALLQRRAEDLNQYRAQFFETIHARTLTVLGEDELVNVFDAEVSVEDAWLLLKDSRVETASIIEEGGDVFNANGLERASFMRAYNGGSGASVDGSSGGRVGGAVTIGVLECNASGQALTDAYINTSHVGFQKQNSSASRILSTTLCRLRGFNRKCLNHSSGDNSSHATAVMSMAGGSILHGQDPDWPGVRTVAQWMRSSPASGTNLRNYLCRRQESGPNLRTGLSKAVSDGVDVVNISYGWPGSCATTKNEGNLNSMIAAATAAGTVVVGSAGNEGVPSAGCNVGWPAVHRNVVAVSGLDTDSPPIWNWPHLYGVDGLANGSSRGAKSITLSSGANVLTPMVSVAAPFHFRLLYGKSSALYSGSIRGTSFSSPAVASLVALSRAHLHAMGHPLRNDAHVLHAYALLMGDGRSSPTGMTFDRSSAEYGFGGVRFTELNNAYLGATRSYMLFRNGIVSGATNSYIVNSGMPLPSSVTGFKFVLHVVESSWAGLPDLTVRAVNTCPSGGGERVIASAIKQAGLGVIRLRAAALANACLRVDVIGGHVKSGGASYAGGYILYSSERERHTVF